MPSAITFLAIFSIAVFLGGSAFGALLLLIISIHRTRRAPLTQIHGQRQGAVSRCMLTSTRTDRREKASDHD